MADKKQPSKDAERLANLLADQQIDLDEIAEEYSEKHLKIFTCMWMNSRILSPTVLFLFYQRRVNIDCL